MAQPVDPMVYHITHVDNLPSIVADQCLWSDAEMMARGGPTATIGMTGIKQRRLRLPVAGRPGLMVGACVPFYFCPRSVMLFLLHKGNHPEVTYKGGQDLIVHLEARLADVVACANRCGTRWAFSLTNAGATYTPFRTDVADLAHIDWDAVQSNDWRDPVVKEGKQGGGGVKYTHISYILRPGGVLRWGFDRRGAISGQPSAVGRTLGAGPVPAGAPARGASPGVRHSWPG